MKNNGTKNQIFKLSSRENHIKVKKKNENSNTNASIKANNKSNKNKESLFNRTSFNTNSNFFSVMDLMPKNLSNKNDYNTIIQAKKMNLNMKNRNRINDFEKVNYKFFTNRKNVNLINQKENKKINILKDKSKENISNNFYQESKNIKANQKHKNKINNNDKMLLVEKASNSYEKIKQMMEMTTLMNNNQKNRNHKNIKKNKTNLKSYGQINKNINASPLNMEEIASIHKKLLPIKKNNSTTNSKMENNNDNNKKKSNSYYSCYNFYQKENNSDNNLNKNNYNYNKMMNTINNFEFHNYRNIYRIEEKFNENNKNKSNNYISIEKENISLNKEKRNSIKNMKNTVQYTNNKKTSKNIVNKNDENNYDKRQILDKILNKDKNKFIEYKKKLIQYFCKGIEDFIFMRVKKNFNDFISNLKQFSIDKNTHYLLLKRLQNKAIQKNFYKYKEKASFYNYLTQNETNSNYSSIIQNNNNNKKDNIPNDFTKGYIRKRSIYNLNKTQSPSLTEYYDRNNDYFERLNYSHNMTSDIQNKENFDNLNMNNYNQDNKLNFNNTNIYYSKKNNFINGTINFDFDQEERIYEKHFPNKINNNIYIPKKFKSLNTSKTIPINIKENNMNNYSYVLSPFVKLAKSHNIFSKKLNHDKKFNQTQDLYPEPIHSKISIKKYSSNDNFQKIYNSSCNNFSNNNFYRENDTEILNKTNDKIIIRNNYMIPAKNFDTDINELNSIYKKKLNINISSKMYNKPKSNKIQNQILDINLPLNNKINESLGQFLSPNIEKNINPNLVINPKTDLVKKQSFIPPNLYSYPNIRMSQTEPRREMQLNFNPPNKFGNIQELTVNLSKNNNVNNKVNNQNKENVFIYSKNDFDNCIMKESDNNNIIINNYDEFNDEKNLINEETDENQIREIIIKDVSSTDRKLNVFIKYIEMPNINEMNQPRVFYYNYALLKYIHIDSFSIPAMYEKISMSNIYYKNYCYGSRLNNNKIKFNKILSSIIEEEEKSKAAGSINNSLVSDEDANKTGNNLSHFFIQSVKYFSNLLQNIFDDKKKDSYHQFFKILKKIKNDFLLQGLINEKKSRTLNQSKNEEKEDEKENS